MNLRSVLPPLGNRIVKSAVAVYICLLLQMFIGGSAMNSAVAAIICIQPYVADSKSYAHDRILGTIIGSLWGYLFLTLLYLFPILSRSTLLAYTLMALLTGAALYSTVVLKKTSTSALVVIVYLGLAVSYPDGNTPLADTLRNLGDTILGTLVAVGVNIFRFPRKKHPERLFFVRTQDLVPDRYQQIPSNVHVLLDRLYSDGARICLVSRWAPAFILSQMGLLNVNAPMILMDGAALYDLQENRYLHIVSIPHENLRRLLDLLDEFHASANIYTVQNQTMCIYRHGPMTDAERMEYDIMKRSPYRNYLEGHYQEEDIIASVRVIGTKEYIRNLDYRLKSVLPPGMFRVELYEDIHFPGYSGLYIYDHSASVPAMKRRMVEFMRVREHTELVPVDVLPLTARYSSEHDAPILLHRLKNLYEPISFFPKKK